MKTLRRILILTHRYLGIALSLLVVVWFASGIVMMYAGGMPRLLPELRLDRRPALEQARQLPLHRFRVEDGDGTDLYVQPQLADVTMLTTRRSRLLAWVGTIPHWLYFSALRANQRLWYRVVVWSSALVCVVTVLGQNAKSRLCSPLYSQRWAGSGRAASGCCSVSAGCGAVLARCSGCRVCHPRAAMRPTPCS